MFNLSAILFRKFSGAFLGDKSNYISRKLSLVYWALHTLTFIYLMSPIGQQLRVAAVKNRFGRHTADGKDYITLFTNYGSCQISDADDYGRMLNRDARFESMRDKVG